MLLLAVPLLVVAVLLALLGALRGLPFADMVALFLVAGTFLGVGVFLAPLDLGELYAFLGVGIFTAQVSRFRSMVRPFLKATDRTGREALRSLYLTFLQRLGFLVILVVLVSLMLFAAATASTFLLTTELTAFLLGVGILLALLAIARLRS